MIALLLLLSLSGCKTQCPSPDMIGDFEPQDVKVFERAVKGCAEHFPEAPCLKKFEKRANGAFWATCGASNTGE